MEAHMTFLNASKSPNYLSNTLAALGLAVSALLATATPAQAQTTPELTKSAPAQGGNQHDGLHDFDFLIGSWKAHLKKLLHPLTGSKEWVEYDGTSATHKVFDERANVEEFEVDSPASHLHIKGQTMRLYNPQTGLWNLYLIYADKGQLDLPATIGHFDSKQDYRQGYFYDQEVFDGTPIIVQYHWSDLGPHAAHFEQSFSVDGGKSWEVNWICDLSR
jgi:hypothetical protein